MLTVKSRCYLKFVFFVSKIYAFSESYWSGFMRKSLSMNSILVLFLLAACC